MDIHTLRSRWAYNVQLLKQLQWACTDTAKRSLNGTISNSEASSFANNLQKCTEALQFCIQKSLTIERTLKNYEIDVPLPIIKDVLLEQELMKYYTVILMEGCKLIFDYSISIFRIGTEPRFMLCLIKLYLNLDSITELLGNEGNQFSDLLNSFEYQFMTQYNIINCNTIHLDQVRDIFAKSNPLIAPPLLTVNDIEKRGYFFLSSVDLHIDNKLIEIAQLKNGHLAVFYVNSQRQSFSTNGAKQLLKELVEGRMELLNMGRTLLFQTLKQRDMVIFSEFEDSLELVTNNSLTKKLLIQCVDKVSWNTYWKIYLENLFSEEQARTNVKASTSMLNPSHSFQNFKIKHTKLSDLRPVSHQGIALNIPQKKSQNCQANITKSDDLEEDPGFKFAIHQSNPINEIYTSQTEELITSPSLNEIEYLSYDKLIALDRSLELTLSPKLLESPREANYKTVSQTFSLDRINNISQNTPEVSDQESIVSNDELEKEPVFNPSVEDHKPQLLRKKSSLLSIFSNKNKSKNKNNLKLEINSQMSSSNLSLNSASSSRTFFSVNSNDSTSTTISDKYIEDSDRFQLDNTTSILQLKVTKASCWDKSSWQVLSSFPLLLSLVKDHEAVYLTLQNPSNSGRFKFVTRISNIWKTTRSTAKDIQISIPTKDILATILDDLTNTTPRYQVLSLRTEEAERLKNTIDHCINGDMLSSISNSTTTRTLSSDASSSYMSQVSSNVSRSSTEVSDLNVHDFKSMASVKNILVLSDIKARLHTKNNGRWCPRHIGLVNIYSLETPNNKKGIRFELTTDTRTTFQFNSKIHDLKRLGRTGIAMIDDSEYLFEFPNNVITEQIYRYIAPSHPMV